MSKAPRTQVDPVLIASYIVVNVERSDYLSGTGRFSELLEHLQESVETTVRESGWPGSGVSISTYSFKGSSHPTNSGRCKTCGRWVSAQNRPDIVIGLGIGAAHGNDYFCWEHLPEDSEWLQSLPPEDLICRS